MLRLIKHRIALYSVFLLIIAPLIYLILADPKFDISTGAKMGLIYTDKAKRLRSALNRLELQARKDIDCEQSTYKNGRFEFGYLDQSERYLVDHDGYLWPKFSLFEKIWRVSVMRSQNGFVIKMVHHKSKLIEEFESYNPSNPPYGVALPINPTETGHFYVCQNIKPTEKQKQAYRDLISKSLKFKVVEFP
jgi:hypothetical protein